MALRCPRCSAEATDVSFGGEPACARCGHRFLAAPAADATPSRSPLASLAGARDKLKNATQDLFRLSGGHSIPVSMAPEASVAPPPVEITGVDSAPPRSSQASVHFSLEELMKSGAGQLPESQRPADEVEGDLWGMQAATPLFGTAQDQALLTTPLEQPKSSAMHSMTVPSHRPPAWPPSPAIVGIGAAIACALIVGGFWLFGSDEPASAPGGAVAAFAPAREAESVPVRRAEPAPAPSPPEPVVAAEPVESVASPPVPKPAPEAELEPRAPARPKPVPKPTSSKKRSARSKSSNKTRSKVSSFSKAAAKQALVAAAGRASGCRKGQGGKGKVQLTFATSGRVSSARIVSGPFAGTATGRCALKHFRSAKVPRFSGKPVTVAKSFRVR